ncbi:MAG: dockerin type I domain-containing protein, partial [Candidatus Thorarchaeota archaeon]
VAHDPDLDPLTLTLYNPPANAIFVDSGNGAGSMKFVPDVTQVWNYYNFRYFATDTAGNADTLVNWVRVVAFLRGDSNSDGNVDVADVTFLITYVFRGGPAPALEEAADCNNDQTLDISDALYLVNFIFRGGPPPAN